MAGGMAEEPVVELFLDLTCPFSRKMFYAVHDDISDGGKLEGKAKFILQNVIQPWHAQSTVLHEAALAVKRLDASQCIPFCKALYDNYDSFTSSAVREETRGQTVERLVALAEKECGVSSAEMRKLLETKGDGNASSAVTQEIKWYVKQHRARGVHVTPTVFVNGIEAPQCGSAWTAEDWAAMITQLAEARQWESTAGALRKPKK